MHKTFGNNPTLKFRFDALTAILERFVAADGDDDRQTVLFLKFRALAKIVRQDVLAITGRRTHFAEEASRVMEWMRYEIGFNPDLGYCPDAESARTTLRKALTWG